MAKDIVRKRFKFFQAAVAAFVISLIGSGTIHAAGSQKTRFWNLTGETIVKFELAPTGTTQFGPDQCKNDKDGAVDDDERLQIQNVASGAYDARIAFKSGRVCFAKNIAITDGKIFSIETKQLTDCTPPK
jgi:hypothetical protein